VKQTIRAVRSAPCGKDENNIHHQEPARALREIVNPTLLRRWSLRKTTLRDKENVVFGRRKETIDDAGGGGAEWRPWRIIVSSVAAKSSAIYDGKRITEPQTIHPCSWKLQKCPVYL
jgi:hypothetical protein